MEKALAIHGAPVYVRHEIVHNKYVVESLRNKGAVFVKELHEIPDGDAPVIFSAHGVPKSVPEEAMRRRMFAIDATCPLVTKVHREATIHAKRGRHVLLVGHSGHPEVVGTMGHCRGRYDHAGRDARADVAPAARSARSRQSRLRDADDALRRPIPRRSLRPCRRAFRR